MSAWRLLVDTIYQAGPKTLAQLEWMMDGDIHSALTQAGNLGLLVRPGGPVPSAIKWRYGLTDKGLAVAQRRIAHRPPGRLAAGRPKTTLVPTWLSALPATNMIRLQGQA